MFSECVDAFIRRLCEVQATSFRPLAKVNGRIQVPADCQRCVARRSHLGGEPFQVTSRIADTDVVGSCEKLRTVHVFLSLAASSDGHLRGYVMRSSMCRLVIL